MRRFGRPAPSPLPRARRRPPPDNAPSPLSSQSDSSFAAPSRAARGAGGIRWPVCTSAITALAFSPSGSTLAVAARDGVLRLLDYPKGTLSGGWKSYFGAFLACAWSPDGRFVAAAGESDCVEVWSTDARALVARAEGHSSWVSGVAFDPLFPGAGAQQRQAAEGAAGTSSFRAEAGAGAGSGSARGLSAAAAAPAGPGPSAAAAALLQTSSGAPPAPSAPPLAYRFASVGQDAAVALWDLQLDDRRATVPLALPFTPAQARHLRPPLSQFP